MTVLALLLWFGAGILSSFIVLWRYHYILDRNIKGDDIAMSLIWTLFGPMTLFILLFVVINTWYKLKFKDRIIIPRKRIVDEVR